MVYNTPSGFHTTKIVFFTITNLEPVNQLDSSIWKKTSIDFKLKYTLWNKCEDYIIGNIHWKYFRPNLGVISRKDRILSLWPLNVPLSNLIWKISYVLNLFFKQHFIIAQSYLQQKQIVLHERFTDKNNKAF